MRSNSSRTAKPLMMAVTGRDHEYPCNADHTFALDRGRPLATLAASWKPFKNPQRTTARVRIIDVTNDNAVSITVSSNRCPGTASEMAGDSKVADKMRLWLQTRMPRHVFLDIRHG